ncbi:hypothetical protein NIASO_17290 [Niabella soli DSM 19437]|uniref:Uncharacterized protein n=1 Tax=Niabella soli DSM 19437 TaxID=929713 RepID=W0F4D8_9BACT|nr:hypothetical protein NIASO_17290 [Niabella soli DSM 19437]
MLKILTMPFVIIIMLNAFQDVCVKHKAKFVERTGKLANLIIEDLLKFCELPDYSNGDNKSSSS